MLLSTDASWALLFLEYIAMNVIIFLCSICEIAVLLRFSVAGVYFAILCESPMCATYSHIHNDVGATEVVQCPYLHCLMCIVVCVNKCMRLNQHLHFHRAIFGSSAVRPCICATYLNKDLFHSFLAWTCMCCFASVFALLVPRSL